MWEWFMANSIWIFIASAFVLILLLFIRDRVQGRVEKAVPEKMAEGGA